MMKMIKEFLKRILPPPTRAFNREVERILTSVEAQRAETKTLQTAMQTEIRSLREENLKLEQRLQLQTQSGYEKLVELVKAESQQVTAMVKAESQETMLKAKKEIEKLEETFRVVQAVVDQWGNQCATEDANRKTMLAEMEREWKTFLRAELDRSVIQTTGVLKQAESTILKHAKIAALGAQEAVWAQVFNNTIKGSKWMKNQTFSPGRWALGYPALYAVYRVLNETRPKKILELGLGQSTRVISQYAEMFTDVTHYVVEHDQNWMDFFAGDFPLPQNTTMVQLDWGKQEYGQAQDVRIFSGFEERFDGEKFDMIVIDAPLGGDMKEFARIDVLKMLPHCLADDFVIALDDSERPGEISTMREMESQLKNSGVAYAKGSYQGEKCMTVLASEQLKFVCTM